MMMVIICQLLPICRSCDRHWQVYDTVLHFLAVDGCDLGHRVERCSPAAAAVVPELSSGWQLAVG